VELFSHLIQGEYIKEISNVPSPVAGMAEWSKALDSSNGLPKHGFSSGSIPAWVRIPLPANIFSTLFKQYFQINLISNL
jgi:hypothetical protein